MLYGNGTVVGVVTIGSNLTFSGGVLSASITGGGGGDVFGPASSTDNAIARFDTTTGKLLQNSLATIDDAGILTTSGLVSSTLTTTGNVVHGISAQGTRIGNNPSTVADLNVGTFGIHCKGSVNCDRGPAAVSYSNRAFEFAGWAWIQLNTAYDLVFAAFTGGEAIRIVQAGGVVITGLLTCGTGSYTFLGTTDVTSTPSGTTQTINLASGNHQTLSLASATGATTVTLTPPATSSAGTIIVKQHGTTPRSITWASSQRSNGRAHSPRGQVMPLEQNASSRGGSMVRLFTFQQRMYSSNEPK